MDPEILINSPESDEDLFDIGYPPSSGQQTDLSQASERSRVRSAISVPHTSRHRSRSSSPNEIRPTPDRSQASSTLPARANSRGRNRYSQLQSPHHRQPASLAAPGHSQRRSRQQSPKQTRDLHIVQNRPESSRLLRMTRDLHIVQNRLEIST
ncbi:hypothetical protein OYC64_000176 [Pagothenia borchgrevinki]|uniref:Uncharacterized protein n=1 Tax=Pagothenia borchgrevinki TaxID=8213 RepID=A0ABD2HD06_PAGBO